MKRELSQLRVNLLIAEEAGLLDDAVGRAVEQSIRYGCAGDFEHKYLAKLVSDHEHELMRCPFLKPRGLNRGDFVLGYDPRSGDPIRVPLEYMSSPILICGSTGSGKTTTARFWSCQFGVLCPGFWFIDCMKSEGRCVAEFLHKAGFSCSIVDTQQFKCNPLEVPPFVSPESFIGIVADSLVRVLVLPATAGKILRQALFFLFTKHGIFQKNTTYPTLFELYEFVCQSGKQFHAQAKEALLTALAPVLMELRSVLAYRKGWNILDLARHKIIFEFNSASEVGKNLLTNCGLILSTFQSRVAQGFSNVGRDHYLAIYFDEGSSLIEADDATISRWIGLVRGVGLALTISNQSAVTISQRVMSNIPNRFICQLSSYADLNVLSSSCGLDSNQKKYLAQRLKPGLLLATLAQGNWRHPFLMTTPLMDSGNNQYQGEGCQALDSLPVVAAPEFLNWMPEWARKEFITSEHELELSNQTPNGDTEATAEPDTADRGGLALDEFRLLEAISADPCQPVSFYPAKARLSSRKALRVRKSLVAKKMIQEQTTQTSGGRGRPSKLLALTSEAMDLLERIAEQRGK